MTYRIVTQQGKWTVEQLKLMSTAQCFVQYQLICSFFIVVGPNSISVCSLDILYTSPVCETDRELLRNQQHLGLFSYSALSDCFALFESVVSLGFVFV